MNVVLTKLALLQKMRTLKLIVGSCAVRGIDEMKAKNVPSFSQQGDKRTQTKLLLIYKTERRTLSTRCAPGQNIMRKRNRIDFKSEQENCVFMNGL